MNDYRITRAGDDESPTMSLCVERNVQTKRQISSFLSRVSTAFKLVLVTFAIDPFLPVQLTLKLYGEWPDNQLLHPFLKQSVLWLMVLYFIKRVIDSSLWKEELLIVREFGVQLNSFDIQKRSTKHKFIDIARVRDLVLNEVSRSRC